MPLTSGPFCRVLNALVKGRHAWEEVGLRAGGRPGCRVRVWSPGGHLCLYKLPVCSRPQSGQTWRESHGSQLWERRCRAPGSARGGRGGRAAGLEDRPHGTDAPLQESHFSFAGKTGHLDGVRGGQPPSQVLASLLPSPQPVRVSTGPWPMSPEESSKQLEFLNLELRQLSSKSQLP